jgi:hypothetical protein
MMGFRHALTVTFLGLAVGLLAAGGGADQLVLLDGSILETDGPFEVDSNRVLFTLPNGTLGSLPVSEVDLEATRALAAAAAEKAAPAPEAIRPKAVLVITDADVGHPNLNRVSEQAPSAETADAVALEVTSWQENVDLSRGSVEIVGTIANPTANPATSIAMDVLLYHEDGTLLERRPARFERDFLNPDASMRFEVRFRETLSYDRVDFEIRSRGFLARPPADESDLEGEVSAEGI